MNIYGCSVLRHLKGNVRCAASAAHDNNVNAVTSTGVHTITHSSSQRTPRASQSSSVRVSVDTCHSAQPDGAGAAQRGSRACGCARHARCARCHGVCCMRAAPTEAWGSWRDAHLQLVRHLEDDLGVAERRVRRRGCSRDRVQLGRLKAVRGVAGVGGSRQAISRPRLAATGLAVE